jgi:hypothetical protein
MKKNEQELIANQSKDEMSERESDSDRSLSTGSE